MKSVWRIGVKDEFSAGHALRNYKGKCERLHGHNFGIEVVLESSTLDTSVEYAIDFTIVKQELKKVLTVLDHTILNELDVFAVQNPTSENIARFIYKSMQQALQEYKNVAVYQVIVSERSIQYACYMEQEK